MGDPIDPKNHGERLAVLETQFDNLKASLSTLAAQVGLLAKEISSLKVAAIAVSIVFITLQPRILDVILKFLPFG